MTFLNDQQRKTYEEHHELDFAIALGDAGRFRVNAFLQNRGESIVFRTIPTVIPTLEQLNMPKIVGDLTKRKGTRPCHRPYGVVVNQLLWLQ